MRVLVLGDSYCPAASLRPAFVHLESVHEITYRDVVDEPTWHPETDSDRSIREYLGSPAQVIAHLAGHEVLVVQGAPVTAAVLDAAPLRLVCVTRGGPVNVDGQAAASRRIPVVVTPGKNATAVAELTIALVVALARRLPDAQRHVDGGGPFAHDNYEGAAWFGHDLAGHTLGLVGLGQVGRRVAERAQAFDMEVIAHDPFVDGAAAGESGIHLVGLDELLAASDHVSVHARLTPANRGMFDAARFAAMRPGATFVNTARAELVDEAALVEALRSGRLGGAALDVTTPSPAEGRHPLLDCPNVVILPHVGGATFETLANGGRMAAAEIERLAAGLPFEHPVAAAGQRVEAGTT